MKQLLKAARVYLRQMTLWDVALLKLCLCAMGVIIGTFAPAGKKRIIQAGAGLIFVVTYVPLMIRFFAALGKGISFSEK